VIHHFLAYSLFYLSLHCLDMINLSDADVEYYNRIAHMTFGLATQHQLAQYLRDYEIKDKETGGTHRTRFVRHVWEYNMSQKSARKWFWLAGLMEEDVEVLVGLNERNGFVEGGGGKEVGLAWASAAVAEERKRGSEEWHNNATLVARAVDKCISEYQSEVDVKVGKYRAAIADQELPFSPSRENGLEKSLGHFAPTTAAGKKD